MDIPKIFVSYSRKDQQFVHRLMQDLKRYGIDIWDIESKIQYGDGITKTIQRGIDESDYIAVIMSPNSMNSKWVNWEYRSAIQKNLKEGKRTILPIYYETCEIPQLLQSLAFADFRLNYFRGLERLLSVFNKTYRAYQNWTLKDWKDMFKGIYSIKMKKYAIDHVALLLFESTADLAEHVRQVKKDKHIPEGIYYSFSKVLAHYFIISNRVFPNISLENIIWNKYPGVCPFCGKKKCNCIYLTHIYNLEKSDETNKTDKKPKRLTDWQNMFSTIYQNSLSQFDLNSIYFQLVRETSELSRSLRFMEEATFISGFADYFGYLLQFFSKLQQYFDDTSSIEDVLWQNYPNLCPICSQVPCICSDVVEITRKREEPPLSSKSSKIGEIIEEMDNLTLDVSDKLERLRKSLKEVE